jgi:hypothetical protein
MGRKTIYVKDSDEALFEWAEKEAGESLSSLFADCLRQRKRKAEREAELSKDGFETIIVEVEDKDGRIRKKQFEGKWIVWEYVSESANGLYYVAFTKRGRIATMYDDQYGSTKEFEVFDSFDEFADSEFPEDFISAVGLELDEDYVEVLNI